ncbi:hypothetical protein Q4544_04780 [Cognatishimia sp. 1_MG-2023]|uniref:hypothetical protein n=1 Tax=Cognatishimia sp. 1_MG-2023 TaxID=3062642 RepID=UPI0026E1222C|nr:hypothetical protein [Cognatishimia sp. 1_MG-2023]MDO6726243.1 hypothetical protein [Cognatishimia sp. 1_MG-2023]
MDKLNILEKNVMIRALPALMALQLVGAITYLVVVGADRGSPTQAIAAIISLISMTLLVGAAGVLLILQLGLRRLRFGS